MSLKIEYPASKINETLANAVLSCSTSATQQTFALVFRNNIGQFITQIPEASSTSSGIMTSKVWSEHNTFKAQIALLNGQLKDLSPIVDAAISQSDANDVWIELYAKGASAVRIDMPTASESSAGIVTSTDYKKLKRAVVQYSAVELTEAVKVETIGITPLGTNYLCFDAQNELLLLAVGFGAQTKYYIAWNGDINGNSSTDYEQYGTIIKTGNSQYIWRNGSWTKDEAVGGDGLYVAPCAAWRHKEQKFRIYDERIQQGDKALLYRYISTRLGKNNSMKRYGVNRVRRNGWICAGNALPLELVKDSESWIVKPRDYDTFPDYQAWRNRDAEGKTEGKSVCQHKMTLRKRCAVLIVRDGKPISDMLEFTIEKESGNLSRIGTAQSYK